LTQTVVREKVHRCLDKASLISLGAASKKYDDETCLSFCSDEALQARQLEICNKYVNKYVIN
jgi:hypothetical protein